MLRPIWRKKSVGTQKNSSAIQRWVSGEMFEWDHMTESPSPYMKLDILHTMLWQSWWVSATQTRSNVVNTSVRAARSGWRRVRPFTSSSKWNPMGRLVVYERPIHHSAPAQRAAGAAIVERASTASSTG